MLATEIPWIREVRIFVFVEANLPITHRPGSIHNEWIMIPPLMNSLSPWSVQ